MFLHLKKNQYSESPHILLLFFSLFVHLQCPSETIPTQALSRCFIAGSSSRTFAPLQTALPKGASWAGLLAVASYEPWGTLTHSLHRVAERSILTLALLIAAWAPVFVITGWKVEGQLLFINYEEYCSRLCCFSQDVETQRLILYLWKNVFKTWEH